MVLFIGFETSGYRLTVYYDMSDKNPIFNQYYPLDIDRESIFERQDEIAYRIYEDISVVEKKLGEKIKKFHMICQNNYVFVKDIEVLDKSSKKDTDLIIDLEIIQLLNLNKHNYNITYKKGPVDESGMVKVYTCLFPNYFYNIAKFIEKNSKIRCASIYSNHQLSEYYISNRDEYFSLVEIRSEDLVISILDEGLVKNSIVIDKSYRDENFVSYMNSGGKILVLGDSCDKSLNDLVQSLVNTEIMSDYSIFIHNKIEEDNKAQFQSISIGKKKSLTNYYLENLKKSKLNKYLINLALVVLVVFILMSLSVIMNNRRLNKDLEEATRLEISREYKQADKPKKIRKNIYGLDIIKANRLGTKLGKMLRRIDYSKGKMVLEFEINDKKKIGGVLSDKLFDKASIRSINKVGYYVEEEVERKVDTSKPRQDGVDEEVDTNGEEKVEVVKEKVNKKKYKYLVRLEIAD